MTETYTVSVCWAVSNSVFWCLPQFLSWLIRVKQSTIFVGFPEPNALELASESNSFHSHKLVCFQLAPATERVYRNSNQLSSISTHQTYSPNTSPMTSRHQIYEWYRRFFFCTDSRTTINGLSVVHVYDPVPQSKVKHFLLLELDPLRTRMYQRHQRRQKMMLSIPWVWVFVICENN